MMKTRPYMLLVLVLAGGCGPSGPDRPVQKADIPGAASPLMEIVQKTEDPDAKWRAVRALGSLRYKGAVPLLIGCLKDPHPYVRSNAARALGDMRVAEASGPLLDLLKSETHGGVIEQTSSALRYFNVREAVPLLKQAADHESDQTRIWVIQAIGDLGSRTDVPFLAKRLYSISSFEQEAAARAIEKLADVDFGLPRPDRPQDITEFPAAIERARTWWEEQQTHNQGIQRTR